MELYHNRMSVCSEKVRIVMAEKGLTATEYHLDLAAGESHTPEYLTLNAKGVVPTLVDHGKAINESTVICEYLDDAYPELRLRPEDPYARAQMRLWTMMPDAGLHVWCGIVSFAIMWRHQDRTQQMAKWSPQLRAERMEAIEKGLNAARVAPALRNHVDVFRKMGKALETSPWLTGDTYSLADIAMLPYVYRFADMALAWIWEEDPEMKPIDDWLERCRQRRGFAGIRDYHDENVVADMMRYGAESKGKVAELLA